MEYVALGTLVVVIFVLIFAGGWQMVYTRKLIDRLIAVERPEAMPMLSSIDNPEPPRPIRYLDDQAELNLQRTGNGS